jgi:predicted membrane protein
LEALMLTVSAGDMELLLPGGNNDAHIITNAGSSEITLPENGRHAINLEVNAGSVTLHLPSDMALHVEVDRALGSFSANDAGLRQVDGQENVWETANYNTATNRLDLTIHIAVGSVTID